MPLLALSSHQEHLDTPDRDDCEDPTTGISGRTVNSLCAAVTCFDRISALPCLLDGTAPRRGTDSPAYGLADNRRAPNPQNHRYTVFEDQQGGNNAHFEALCYRRGDTYIDLYSLESPSSLYSAVTERRRHGLGPTGVKADQDRQGRLTHPRPQDGRGDIWQSRKFCRLLRPSTVHGFIPCLSRLHWQYLAVLQLVGEVDVAVQDACYACR